MSGRRPLWWIEAAEAAAFFARPGHEDEPTDDGLHYRAAPRPRITIDPCWAPVLTDRQRNCVKRRYRVRAHASWGRMLRLMRNNQMSMVEFVETLSNEELARGQLKDEDGRFRGAPPMWVPREFHRACLRELLRRGRVLWQENYVQAIRAMTEIASGRVKGATPTDRLRAAQYVVERIEGKIPERLEIQVDAPWEAAIVDIVAEVSDEQIAAARKLLTEGPSTTDENVIDAELVEETPPVRRRSASRRKRTS